MPSSLEERPLLGVIKESVNLRARYKLPSITKFPLIKQRLIITFTAFPQTPSVSTKARIPGPSWNISFRSENNVGKGKKTSPALIKMCYDDL